MTRLPRVLMVCTLVVWMCASSGGNAADWPRFRGPSGGGVSNETGLPLEWSEKKNMIWKTPLPGPGSSSPIILGNRIYLTCYSGYGVDADNPGNKADLKRHLVCLDRQSGKILWTAEKGRDPKTLEHDYTSFVKLHGYASSTPTADETGVYVFYGTVGAGKYDHQGKLLWWVNCGNGAMNFGSAASPILYGDLVIINADVESASLIAFDKKSGREVWRNNPDRDINTWCTPLLVEVKGSHELVSYYTKGKLAGFDPKDGSKLWECQASKNYQCPSPIVHDGIIYAIGDHPGTATAVRAGGRGEVTNTHRVWEVNKGSVVSSPVYHDGHLYWANESNGFIYCLEARTGKIVYQERLIPNPVRIYASGVLADGRIYYVSQQKGTYVLPAKPEFKLLARNVFDMDDSVCNGSPAICQGRIYLRSDRFLYCIGK